MSESENPQAPDFGAEDHNDKPDDGNAAHDTEGHRFIPEFQGEDESPSQQDDDTEGHRFIAE